MPLHFTSSPTRRQFLRETVGTLTILSASPLSASSGCSHWALASDTHIDADPAKVARGVTMTGNLRSAASQILAESSRCEAVFINGDCAYLQGLPEDYRQFRSLLQPLRDAHLDVHMTLGNHDHREHFRQAFPQADPAPGPVAEKHLSVIRTPLVNWFLVDSLQKVNEVTGNLGEAQLRWLDTALDQFPDQPAIILGHHNPQLVPEVGKDGKPRITGLSDTPAFLDLLHRKPQVKAYVFGHTHKWEVTRTAQGLHLVNLPPVAYVFDSTRPNGWVHATVDRESIHLTLRSLNPAHPEHGKTITLAWR